MTPDLPGRGELAHLVNGAGGLSAAPPSPVARIAPAARPAPPAPAPAVAITPLGLLRAFRRRSALALGAAILAAGAAGPAAWFLVPLKFNVHARIQVAAQPPKILFQTMEAQDLTGDSYKRYQSTQQTLVKSHLVLNAALRDPKVARYRMIQGQEDPIAWLQEKLNVEFVSGSEVMEISLSGSDPEEMAGIVNAVKKAYMDEVVNVDAKHRTNRFDNLKSIQKRYEEHLKQRRKTMRDLAETVGSDDRDTLALRQQYAMEHLAYLQKELLEIQSRKRRIDAELKAKEHSEEAVVETAAPSYGEADIDAMVDQNPGVADLLDKLSRQEEQLDSELAHLRRVATNPNADPALQSLRSDIKATRQLLARRRDAVRPFAVRELQRQGARDQVARGDELDEERTMLDDLESQLEKDIKSIKVVNQSLTTNTLDLQSIQDDVVHLETAATKVAAEVEALTVELSAPPRVRVIDDATVPRVRDDKKRLMTIVMATCGSFFAGLFGVVFLELMAHKVDAADEVPRELGLRIIGALPMLPSRAHQARAVARSPEKGQSWHNLLLESIDATRTMLVHAAQTESHRVVMITSAVAGEGKTSLASYLATSLARSGMKALLVDADLRSPSIHRLFDLPRGPGMSEVVRGEFGLDEVIAATPVSGLKVMTAGHCDRQALAVLARGCLGPLFDQLKERFDFVIIDSSPLLPVADAMLIAQQADAVLFSILQEVSRKAKVSAAIQRFQYLNVPVLGAVVAGARGGLYGDSYYGPDASYPGLPESVAGPSQSS